jgi:hypothetical protein
LGWELFGWFVRFCKAEFGDTQVGEYYSADF